MTMTPDWLPFAFLPIFKPEGPTSHDIVARVRKLLPRKLKVGHTGTLDPFASGALLLALGKATKFTDEIHRLPKGYSAVIRLGERTNTLDPTGEVVERRPVPDFDQDDLDRIALEFTGPQLQAPPIFSAKRVGGRKSYELARKNQPVALEPKTIVIHDLVLRKIDDRHIDCRALCSTGAYVRALGRDIAAALGACGSLSRLVRLSVGPVEAERCVAPDQLTAESLGDHLIAVSDILPQFPSIPIASGAFAAFSHGRPFRVAEPFPPYFLGVYKDAGGKIKAIFRCEFDPEHSSLHSRMECYARDKN